MPIYNNIMMVFLSKYFCIFAAAFLLSQHILEFSQCQSLKLFIAGEASPLLDSNLL